MSKDKVNPLDYVADVSDNIVNDSLVKLMISLRRSPFTTPTLSDYLLLVKHAPRQHCWVYWDIPAE